MIAKEIFVSMVLPKVLSVLYFFWAFKVSCEDMTSRCSRLYLIRTIGLQLNRGKCCVYFVSSYKRVKQTNFTALSLFWNKEMHIKIILISPFLIRQ